MPILTSVKNEYTLKIYLLSSPFLNTTPYDNNHSSLFEILAGTYWEYECRIGYILDVPLFITVEKYVLIDYLGII